MKTLSKYFEDVVLSPEPNAFCMLKPGFNQYKDEFEKLLKLNGWTILKHCTKQFTRPEIEDFYIMHKDQGFYHKLCDYMITEACECYSCYKRCKDPYKEMGEFKKKIRDEWGEDEMRNGMHSSDNKENMLKESNIAFNTVNEKLKVSSDNCTPPTYQEYYDLLDAYCKENNEKFLDLTKIYGYESDLLPKYNKNKNIVIYTIRSKYLTIPEITCKTYDFNTKQALYYSINVTYNANKDVDFMEDEYIEKTVKYMKDHIKNNMKTFKEHILEKLKVTKFSGTGITYQEYYDLLDKYCKMNNEKFLDLYIVYGFDNTLLPRYKGIERKSISSIKPIYSSYPEIHLNVYDSSARNFFTYSINVTTVADKDVDFMKDEYIEKTVK